MAEEKSEKWLSYLALTTVVLAACATLSTFYGQKNSTKSVLNEIKSSNQWNYYQAKKIRGYLFEVQKENLATDIKLRGPSTTPETLEELQKRLASFDKKLKKWDEDRETIEKDARKFEKQRDESLRYGQAFGFAVIFLQMAILLSSISALMKRKLLWVIGLFIGGIGIVFFLDGFLLFL